MAGEKRVVIGRVDKVIDTADFVSSTRACRELVAWMDSFGRLAKVGVEGTGAYGAGLPATWATRVSRWWRSTGPTARHAGAGASPTPSMPKVLLGRL